MNYHSPLRPILPGGHLAYVDLEGNPTGPLQGLRVSPLSNSMWQLEFWGLTAPSTWKPFHCLCETELDVAGILNEFRSHPELCLQQHFRYQTPDLSKKSRTMTMEDLL